MAQDEWWADLVSAPAAGGGKNGMSGAENQEMSKAREANRDARSIFPALAETYRVAARYPGGIPETVKDRGALAFGSNGQTAQDYDYFNAMATRAAIAKAKLLGANPSNRDFEVAKQSGANPTLRFQNNQKLIGLDYQAAAQKYFENAFRQRWAARNGGLNGTDKAGHTYADDLARAMQRPEVQTLLTPPWDRRQGARRPAPALTGVKFMGFE